MDGQIKIEFTADVEGLKKAEAEIDALKAKIGGVPPVSNNTAKSFNSLHDQIKNVKAQTQLMTGAMILFGNKSQEIQQVIGKLHGAILLVKGASGLSGLGAAFQGMSLSTLTAKKAFDALKLAFATNPFGLLLTVLTAVVVSMELFADSTDKATESQNKLNEAIEKENQFMSDAYDSRNRLHNQSVDSLKSELELLKLKGATREEIHNKELEINKVESDYIERTKQKLINDGLYNLKNQSVIQSMESKNKQDLRKINQQYLNDVSGDNEEANQKAKDLRSKQHIAEIEAEFAHRQNVISLMTDGGDKMRAQLQLDYDKDIEQLAKKYIDELHLFDQFAILMNDRNLKFAQDSKFIVKRDKPLGPENFDINATVKRDSPLGPDASAFLEDTKRFQEIEEQKKELRVQIAMETEQLLTEIYAAGIQSRIEELQKEGESQSAMSDKALADNAERRKKDIISERDFRKNEKKLMDEKLKNEEIINKKIREEKKKMAILERLEKLFEITIATARNIVAFPALAGLYAALGALQAGVVLAAPLPKYHSGKLAEHSAAEQLAIIRKDETIINPEKSKSFAPTLTAIHKGKIPAIELNRFVRNFSTNDNRKQSISIDTDALGEAVAYYTKDHKNVTIKNIRELAEVMNNNNQAVFRH